MTRSRVLGTFDAPIEDSNPILSTTSHRHTLATMLELPQFAYHYFTVNRQKLSQGEVQ